MRRNYISPEFIYQKVNGTLNMKEQSTYFGSKMLKIADTISVKNDNIIYYQQSTGEQIDYNIEKSLPQIIYNTIDDKSANQTIILDESQTPDNKLNHATWILTIQIKKILTDYIYATLKKSRCFQGVRNNMTINNHINDAIIDYINKNVLDRYKFSKIEMYIQSIPLISVGSLQYVNTFDATIENNQNLFTKIQTETDFNDLDIKVTFNQPDPATQYVFNYYFNLYFEKI
jgi:hypothetical protein